ncbi:GNAT family N-acetyltransferase [Parachitinimonas caeni]|uniref:GNAT family N-acetyltransferase n=1 Tax=Parachitinimonas caeni TaxID=3031301 RepID=A0ABT7E0G4_9NEIS|nr:GNAT family N-acetyltransferase [Parachitinimonas caeni]MDK2125808.1 GNAT family N-acetyltransferase [Parachitinimonas caeni]
MTPHSLQRQFWLTACKSAGMPVDTPHTVWHFGDTPELARQLGSLVRSGVKTASCGLKYWADQDPANQGTVGDVSLITDHAGHPLCVIRLVSVVEHALGEVPEDFALAEGEGDYAAWHAAHLDYFSRTRPADLILDAQTPLLCERYELLYPTATPTLALNGARLRPWQLADAPALARHANSPRITSWLDDRFPSPYSLADAEDWIGGGWLEVSSFNWAIEVDGEAAGSISLTQGSGHAACSASIGYWLTDSRWGRGIASAAVGAVSDFGLQLRGVERIEAYIFDGNHGAVRTLEVNGYEHEGTLRRSLLKAGKPIDQHLYARLRPDMAADDRLASGFPMGTSPSQPATKT